ncbi:MAG: lipid-A-disaccharide synthase [Oscillatoria sp. SIO1A7]|nr:lipid-A-disaccharide synthase [Oscillatoria sp. SIO1A7]
MPQKIFISTGEVSGDLQGALLVSALKRQAAETGIELEIAALGGEGMARAGATLLANTTKIGSVGLVESLPYVVSTLQVQQKAKDYLRENPPDLVVLIDYMGPNLAIASYIRRQLPKTPIVYYIAPQEWVWSARASTTAQIVANCDLLLAVFPEEARYYREKGANVQWVGHPLLDELPAMPTRDEARQSLGIEEGKIAVALLPASREQEIKYLLPTMLEAARILQDQIAEIHFWIPLSLETYRKPIAEAIAAKDLRATILDKNSSRLAIASADLAITKSGTVNLEIALLQVPQVVIYRVHPLTAWVMRRLLAFSIPFMSPPNLVEMKPVVPELLQDQATSANIVREAQELLQNSHRRQQIQASYRDMRRNLGEPGVCDRAARAILSMLV